MSMQGTGKARWRICDRAAVWTVVVVVAVSGSALAQSARSDLLGPKLDFMWGPVLGHAGTTFFTVACRTTRPCAVRLDVGGKTYTSEAGEYHRFRAEGLEPNTAYAYTMVAQSSEAAEAPRAGPYTVRTLPEEGQLVFVALGDNRTNPDRWARVSSAAAGKKPAFSIHTGDLVKDGRLEFSWGRECFEPAKPFFATVPCYPVIGNHEENSPVFLRMFVTPSGQKNWAQEIGPLLLIGLDGRMDWRAGSALTQWLDGVLSASDAKFIFLASHYPPWSSGKHGIAGDPDVVKARTVILPLLEKYRATAMICADDHFYERSEPPGGVTVIVSGGAGADLRDRVPPDSPQNPHSKAFAKKHHYCLFHLDGEVCTMHALTPEGQILDRREWNARRSGPVKAPAREVPDE